MKKINIIFAGLFLVAVLLPTMLCADDLSGKPGAFADVGLGLRSLGMGGAYSALASDEDASRWNPALLDAVRDPVAGFCWTRQFNLIDYQYLSLAIPVGRNIGYSNDIGIGAYVVSAGDAAYRETTIGIAAGIDAPRVRIPVENLRFGTTIKIMMTSFGDDEEGGEDRVTGSSFGYSLDLGVHYQVSEQLSFALVSRELINGINWDSSVDGTYSEGLPRQVVLAAGYELEKSTFGLEYHPSFYDDTSDRLVMGAELQIFSLMVGRVGFAQNLDGADQNRWITAGVGMNIATNLGGIRLIQFGYTHLFHDIDHSPRVGLVVGW